MIRVKTLEIKCAVIIVIFIYSNYHLDNFRILTTKWNVQKDWFSYICLFDLECLKNRQNQQDHEHKIMG